jgi:hypothetical protein
MTTDRPHAPHCATCRCQDGSAPDPRFRLVRGRIATGLYPRAEEQARRVGLTVAEWIIQVAEVRVLELERPASRADLTTRP